MVKDNFIPNFDRNKTIPNPKPIPNLNLNTTMLNPRHISNLVLSKTNTSIKEGQTMSKRLKLNLTLNLIQTMPKPNPNPNPSKTMADPLFISNLILSKTNTRIPEPPHRAVGVRSTEIH